MAELLVTYMELMSPPPVMRISSPDVSVANEHLGASDYLSLYRAVGEAYKWDQRLRLSHAELQRVLTDPGSRVYVLRLMSEAVGMCEFANVGQADVELANFGLVRKLHGRGLGRYLLSTALNECWKFSPLRVWLRTHTNDSERAVPTYTKARFRPFMKRMETLPD